MNRLGWIHTAEHSLAEWDHLAALAAEVHASGLERTLVCGMGGSSLAPQVLAASTARPRAPLHVLDSTDPAAVLAAERAGDPARTLFVIASKSGPTVETPAFYRYFAARARPEQFVAITDPGTPLETLARERGFRAVVAHPADVGGRYAALTAVGMLPAALLGLDGRTLLERACALDPARAKAFGAQLAQGGSAGRDKLALRPPAALATLAHWGAVAGPGVSLPLPRPRPPFPAVTAALQDVRASWGRALGCVTTLGFGPRYLHSTGQLHKGGPNTGLFLVITADDAVDLPIPEQGLTFGELKRAQARGDIRALLARGRRVAHVHLHNLGELRTLRV